jgi:hypothetical protein
VRAYLGGPGPKLVLTSERIDPARVFSRVRDKSALLKAVFGRRT